VLLAACDIVILKADKLFIVIVARVEEEVVIG
jgi:hypothetical protein